MSQVKSSVEPKTVIKSSTKNQTRRIHPSIKKDPMTAYDYLHYDFRFACEDCSHFAIESGTCSIGYNTAPHRKAQQQHDFELGGRMALCRFHEID